MDTAINSTVAALENGSLASIPGPVATERGTYSISCQDKVLSRESQQQVRLFLGGPGWHFGWKSNPKTDHFSFWHKHFAGPLTPDGADADASPEIARAVDCADELSERAPVLHAFWQGLRDTTLAGHRLVRCYANAFSFGCEGTLHTDAPDGDSFTSIYYPNSNWHPNWGGETVFFRPDGSDILTSIYPRPNRLVTFNGAIPHVARGITRSCPSLRMTLMFKTVAV